MKAGKNGDMHKFVKILKRALTSSTKSAKLPPQPNNNLETPCAITAKAIVCAQSKRKKMMADKLRWSDEQISVQASWCWASFMSNSLEDEGHAHTR